MNGEGMKIRRFLFVLLALIPILGNVQAQENYELLWSYDVSDSVRSVSISSDGSFVAAVTNDGKVYVFDKAGNLQWSNNMGAWDVALGPAQDKVIYIAAGPRVHLYDSLGNHLWSSIEFTSSQLAGPEIISAVSVSNDGKYLILGSFYDPKTYLLGSDRGVLWSHGGHSSIPDVSISGDGNYVAVSYGGYGPDLAPVELLDRYGNHLRSYMLKDMIVDVSLSNSGEYVAFGGEKTYLFDRSGNLIWSYGKGGGVSINSDANYIAAADGDIYLFDRSGRMLWSYKPTGLYETFRIVSISSDGSYIAAGSGLKPENSNVYLFGKIKKGSISVSSTPSEATVYLDDVYKGTTPITISDVSIGPHIIKISKSGYNDYSTTVNVEASMTTYVSATLTPIITSELIDKGKTFFTSRGCIACHGASGEGVPGVGPALVGLYGSEVELADGTRVTADNAFILESITKPGAKVVKGYSPMPNLGVTEEEARALASFITGRETLPTPSPTPQPIPTTTLEISSKTDIETKVKDRIVSTEKLVTDLHNLVLAGKRIGADVSEAEEKINSATLILREANESYATAVQNVNEGDLVVALSSGNEAYTKGSAGMEMLDEAKPILYSAIKEKLDEKAANTESLIDTAKSIGLAGGAEEKLSKAKNEIKGFENAFNTEDLAGAKEHILNADKLLGEIKTRIYSMFGGAAVLIGLLGVGVVKVRSRATTRPLTRKAERAQKPRKVRAAREPRFDASVKALRVSGLSKSYKNAVILEDVDFEMSQGRLCAIVGSSGGGKSTLIEGVAGRLKPDEGDIEILGMKADKHRAEVNKLVGFVPQHPELYMDQSVWQNIMNSALKWGVEDAEARAEDILRKLGIYGRKDVPARNLSGGQLKRLSLGMELIREPPLLVLDEPTTGLDPTSRDQIISAISKLVYTDKKTAVFTTHFMDEAEHCDEVIIIGNKGILAKGSPEGLARRMPGRGKVVEVTLEEVRKKLVDKVSKLKGVKKVIREGRVLKIIMDSPDSVEISQRIKEFGGKVEGSRVAKAGMKEVFVYFTGEYPEEGE